MKITEANGIVVFNLKYKSSKCCIVATDRARAKLVMRKHYKIKKCEEHDIEIISEFDPTYKVQFLSWCESYELEFE